MPISYTSFWNINFWQRFGKQVSQVVTRTNFLDFNFIFLLKFMSEEELRCYMLSLVTFNETFLNMSYAYFIIFIDNIRDTCNSW